MDAPVTAVSFMSGFVEFMFAIRQAAIIALSRQVPHDDIVSSSCHGGVVELWPTSSAYAKGNVVVNACSFICDFLIAYLVGIACVTA